jgi:internalin A
MPQALSEAEQRIRAAYGAGSDELDLSSLGLTVLPDSLRGLIGLTELYLADNELTTLPDWLGEFTELIYLSVAGNRLAEVPESLCRLTGLTRLGLQRNRLTALPDALGSLQQLKRLYLENNRLTALPPSLGELTLATLDLEGNPLTSPPPEIVAQGTPSVLSFLRAARTATVQQWVSKVLIVGEGRVGKTSVAKALAGQKHDRAEPTTHGMRITTLPLAHPDRDGVTMRLSVWDFGGQDIYHATHQFFLTGRSLFLLVWNAGEGTDRGRLRYWLETITARAPGAPILIVATYTADRAADIDARSLAARYPAIVGVHNVDCAARLGFDALLKAVTATAAGLPMMGAEWPSSWANAASALTGRDRPPHIPARDMWQTMVDADVTEEDDQRTLAAALHERGEILYFSEVEELVDLVVLDPQWLNFNISRMLDSAGVAARHGLLTTADIDAEWAGISHAQREQMLNLLDRFDVSYRVRDSDDGARAIVVSRLPHTPPDYAPLWEPLAERPGIRELRLVYELPVLPPGIPVWFLAREYRFATEYRWRAGALLRDPDDLHVALLHTDIERRRIELTVRGPLPSRFFDTLDDGLGFIFRRYPGMHIIRWVPCQGHGRCDNMFDYAKIVRRLERGHTTMYCDSTDDGAEVDIAGLLTGIPRPVPTLGALVEDLRRDVAEHFRLTQRDHAQIMTAVARTQQTHCPSVFTVTPGPKRLTKTKHVLRLYCEQPGAWHPLPGDAGRYEFAAPAGWLIRFGPYLATTVKILKATVPYVGPILGIAAHDLHEQIENEIDLAETILASLPAERRRSLERPVGQARTDADFRVLREMLEQLDPVRRWGGLSHILTPEGLSIYVCAEHEATYRRLPPADTAL